MSYVPDYFEFACPVKILSGRKALANLPYELDLLGASRALLVTDKGVVAAGLVDKVLAAFVGSEAEVVLVFDDVPPDSSVTIAVELARLYREKGCDCLVAVGGGSAIDTAKAANVVITERTDNLMLFQGAERIKKKLQPFVVIPTTAGTGSEVTSAAVIKDREHGVKIALTAYTLLPDVALLDPEMTLTMPPKITAATGMDALTHAMEAWYCLQKNPVSDGFAWDAIRLVAEYLVACVERPDDTKARLAMMNAALLAGIAFSNSLVGMVHGLAHACGGVAGVPHGVANAILLPWGLDYNLEARAEMIAELAWPMGVRPVTGEARKDAEAVVEAVRALGRALHAKAGLPTRLREAGVTEQQLPAIAAAAINDGSMVMNPTEISLDEALAVLRKAW